MKLYCDPLSTSSRPVMMLVSDFDLDIEIIHVDLFGNQNQAPEFLAINPLGTVPVLVDGDFTLTESTAILKYLAFKLDLPVYPKALAAQIRVDEATARFGTTFHGYHCLYGTYPQMLQQLAWMADTTKAEMAQVGSYGSQRYLGVLDRQLASHGPFVCGPEVTIADYVGLALVTLADFIAFDFAPYPSVQGWIARMQKRKGWEAEYAGFTGMVAAARSAVADSAA
ncbi:glutathione S-transferase family protein [Limimaricola sp.]|uniref:glutathione S-transferase family protein n=1 Tax=Limimaricola sp. TaxID=2211665 RepID=UPI0025B8734C|nr:glutathione S-transferase family protein [Limimaricola sp.]